MHRTAPRPLPLAATSIRMTRTFMGAAPTSMRTPATYTGRASTRVRPARPRPWCLFLAALLAAGGCETMVAPGAGPTGRQEVPSASLHPEARRAISELRSPYCPGLMLEVCPSPDAEILRDSIESLARSGMGADSIVSRMITEYGVEWRAVPLREGWGWWAWLMPPAAIALGLAIVAFVLHKRRRADGPPPRTQPPGRADEEKLRRAMEDLDASEHPDW